MTRSPDHTVSKFKMYSQYTMEQFAEVIKKEIGSSSKIVFYPKPQDDPMQRKPDISVAKRELGCV